AIQVAGRRIDNGGALDAVVADHVLLIRTAAEADVVEGPAAAVHGTGREQIELRNLPAIHRQLGHFALGDVDANASGAHVDRGQIARGYVDLGRDGSGRHRDIDDTLLPGLQGETFK